MNKTYECKLCPKDNRFKTGSRKKVREHIQRVHGMKGNKPYGSKKGRNSPVTEAHSK